ncbi:MAG TPA: phosphatidate cytidylyltransferase [Dehalococcoidia bacterium]|jgi:phosphatidate cytidylyltransferase|nr:phosphatidate cytidylyltransferase [Dehalococcoidia bacterium]HJM53249.1 phosphatidate cytidylyltransferase [Dehalococcoidia bacterium]
MTLRLITATIAIPALAVILWLGTSAVGALVLVLAGIGGWELAGMLRTRTVGPVYLLLPAWSLALVAAGWLIAEEQAGWSMLLAAFGAGIVPALAILLTPWGAGRRSAFVYAIAAGPYVGIALAHTPILRSVDDGAQWLMLALIVTFAADTAAMLAGITFGRHKLIPRISPNKSWEGLIGGLIGAAIAALVVDTAFDLEIASGMAVVLGIVMAITGTLGDLGVSAFKRHAGVKDSGFLVPGHGGVLDRLDSLLPTIVIVYWVSEWSAT